MKKESVKKLVGLVVEQPVGNTFMGSGGAARNASRNWQDARARNKPGWDKLARFLETKLQRTDQDGRPKYKVLQDGLVEAIRTGVIADNELLPTETDLTAITPFSLGTVQRALKNLVSAGMIVRKAGVGTIVAPWRRELENPLHTRFMDKDGNVLTVYTEVLSRRRVTSPGPWEDFLHAGTNTLIIKRRLLIERPDEDGGDFCYYNEFYVDGAKYPMFRETPKSELNGLNFKRKMMEEFGLVITRVSNHMSIHHATAEIAAALNIDADTALIRQRVYVYSMEGPLYYQDYWIPPEVPEIVIDTALESFGEL